jgi:hypothetical protein
MSHLSPDDEMPENATAIPMNLRRHRKQPLNQRRREMKYIIMMNTMRAGHGVPEWAQKDLQAHIAFMIGLNKDLRQSGEFVSAEGLAFPDQAKLVRAGKNGVPITDGVFPESKEFLAGYWIVDVDSPERAYVIAARVSAAPGPGGAPMNMPIEVRPVMSGPPPEML